MESGEVLAVLLLGSYVFYILHTVWDDGCSRDSRPPHCSRGHVLLSWLLEFVHWFSYSSTGTQRPISLSRTRIVLNL